MTDAWQAVGTLASVAGLTGFAISGGNSLVAGYQAYASPYTSLTESERTLKRVKSLLQGLSQQRRDEIEIAMRSKATNCKSLEDLEGQLQTLMDMHRILTRGYGEVPFTERHLLHSKLRENISDLQEDACELLNDTLTTTVPHLMDKGSSRENPRWPASSPESPDVGSTPSTPLPDAAASPYKAYRRLVRYDNRSVIGD